MAWGQGDLLALRDAELSGLMRYSFELIKYLCRCNQFGAYWSTWSMLR